MRILLAAIVALIFGLISVATFGGGGYLLARNMPMIGEGWRSRAWPAAVGEIKQSAAVRKAAGST